jgi:hypothetical protein
MAEDVVTMRSVDQAAIERWEGEGGRAIEREEVLRARPLAPWRSIPEERARSHEQSSRARLTRSLLRGYGRYHE